MTKYSGLDVVDPRAVVHARDFAGVASPDEPVEEDVASPAAVRDASEARVLPREADASVPQDQCEEARLALVEAELRDGSDPFVHGHRHSSSAGRGCRLPPPRPPPVGRPMPKLRPR